MSDATLRLEHSRDRIRRFIARTEVAASQHQRHKRNRWLGWIGLALTAGAGVLFWQRPWRHSPGLPNVMALVVTCLKAPDMLHTLTGHLESLASWWRKISQPPPPEEVKQSDHVPPVDSGPKASPPH